MSESESQTDRRKFTRTLFSSEASISWGGAKHFVKLVDLSLNGALIELDPSHHPEANTTANLSINLDQENTINMEVTVRHIENSHVGLHCEHFDLDSATHLRRLVELNVGDDEILNRELSQLGT